MKLLYDCSVGRDYCIIILFREYYIVAERHYMFGWVSEKEINRNRIRKPSSEGVKKFLDKLKEMNREVEVDRKNGNIATINGKHFLLLSHNNSEIWQPYCSTIDIMNRKFEDDWGLIGLNYKNDGRHIFYQNGKTINLEIEKYKNGEESFLSKPQNRENYYEIKSGDMDERKIEDMGQI